MPLPEKSLIARIRKMAMAPRTSSLPGGGRGKSVITGIGDDCAVLRLPAASRLTRDALITTDFTLEGVHFRRAWHAAESVGHRCLARGLSDIAAMGGDPEAVFLSLALPRDLPQHWFDHFLRGLLQLAGTYGVTLAGGDTAQSPSEILADIILLGSVPQGKAVLRSGARVGHRIYVSGDLGGAAAALLLLHKKPKRKLNPRQYSRHFFPQPRVDLGRILREKKLASAMIDTSDGLSTDLAHLCAESGVGAEILAQAIPRARLGKPPRPVDLALALHGGEDYELLFTVPADKRVPARIAGVPVTYIGQITRSRKVFLRNGKGVAEELHPRGWEHFRK